MYFFKNRVFKNYIKRKDFVFLFILLFGVTFFSCKHESSSVTEVPTYGIDKPTPETPIQPQPEAKPAAVTRVTITSQDPRFKNDAFYIILSELTDSNLTIQLSANVLVENDEGNTLSKTVIWKSSAENFATVNGEGLVTLKDEKTTGETTITATSTADSTKSAEVIIKVGEAPKVDVESVTIDKKTLNLEFGSGADESKKTATLAATVLPDNATLKNVTWTSSDENVALVDTAGKVTAQGGGAATITATADGKSGACTVNVVAKGVGTINVDASKLGEHFEKIEISGNTATATMKDDAQYTFTWIFNGKKIEGASGKVATIPTAGLVSGMNYSITAIAKTQDGIEYSAIVTFTYTAN